VPRWLAALRLIGAALIEVTFMGLDGVIDAIGDYATGSGQVFMTIPALDW
jgi:hypothetical protein